MTALDVLPLPAELIWNPGTPGAIDLADVARSLSPVVESMIDSGILPAKESFGFAMAAPDISLNHPDIWDDPQSLIGLTFGWGPEQDRYIANACRKIRASAREDQDTETIRREHSHWFVDVIESVEPDGTFTWGDFPYDGAAFTVIQGRRLLTAVSAYPKELDPIVARLFGGCIGHAMYKSDLQAAPAT